jgi:hypothetical protein
MFNVEFDVMSETLDTGIFWDYAMLVLDL